MNAETQPKPTVQEVDTPTPQNMTVREAIAILAQFSDMDAELAISFYNSDPIPVQTIEENTDNQVVIYGS